MTEKQEKIKKVFFYITLIVYLGLFLWGLYSYIPQINRMVGDYYKSYYEFQGTASNGSVSFFAIFQIPFLLVKMLGIPGNILLHVLYLLLISSVVWIPYIIYKKIIQKKEKDTKEESSNESNENNL